MKKKNILNLIKYHYEHNDEGFRNESYEIAAEFNIAGDQELGEYILALMSDRNYLAPQALNNESSYFRLIPEDGSSISLPDVILDDLSGIINAVGYNAGINKFLFYGAPGSGKTESVKYLAKILDRQLFSVDFNTVIDSKLGQTSKNIADLFSEMNNIPYPEKAIFLFDEIDALALDRIDSKDLREMGRATSSFLKELDNLNSSLILIATTNLYESFDKALLRRFDNAINFNRYSQDDLLDIAEIILNDTLKTFKIQGKNTKLFRKLVALLSPIPYPGDLRNIIRTSVAFSNKNEPLEYLRKLLKAVKPDCDKLELKDLQALGFTIRDIEILKGISKSSVARALKED